MAITALGKKLRMLRLDRGEVMKDMADALQVSSAYLSSIEHGKKTPSDKVVQGIKQYYQLDQDEVRALHEAIALSQTSISINLQGADEEQRMLATAFARKISSLGQSQKDQLAKLLNGDMENKNGGQTTEHESITEKQGQHSKTGSRYPGLSADIFA